MEISESQRLIDITCKNMSTFLQEKNRGYGNSSLSPLKIFSKHEPDNNICQRLDEKINRIINSKGGLRKDDVVDILGYAILLCIQKDWTKFEDLL